MMAIFTLNVYMFNANEDTIVLFGILGKDSIDGVLAAKYSKVNKYRLKNGVKKPLRVLEHGVGIGAIAFG
jgi:hypothetical protein